MHQQTQEHNRTNLKITSLNQHQRTRISQSIQNPKLQNITLIHNTINQELKLRKYVQQIISL